MKKIAIPITENNRLDDHFGHCAFYGIYTISDNNEIIDIQTIKSTQGCGCKSNIAAVLSGMGVSIMIAGGIGDGAIHVLNSQGIKVIRGCSGNANDVINQYLAGNITDSGSSCSQHGHHHSGESACNH